MNHYKSFMLFAVLLFAAGCKKSNSFTGAKIYTLSDFRAGITYTYTYNSDGTVSTVQKSTGGKITYGYNSGTVLQSTVSSGGVTTDATSYSLNSSGYASSSQGQYLSQNSSAQYSYDDNGQLTEQKNFTSGTVLNSDLVYNNSNKDIVSLTTTNNGGTKSYDYYTYNATVTNTLGVQNKGLNFLGVSNANIVLSDIKINQGGDTTDVISFRYHYDGSTRPDTIVSHNKSGFLVDSFAVTYY